eukprot:6224015-Amphidinium_carterae.1
MLAINSPSQDGSNSTNKQTAENIRETVCSLKKRLETVDCMAPKTMTLDEDPMENIFGGMFM